MPPVKKPWFRVYVEMVRDRKLTRLTPAQRWLWVVMLSCARESPVPGYLLLSETEALTGSDLASASGVSRSQVSSGVATMEQLGMIVKDGDLDAWFINSWWDRQYESDHRPHH